VTLTADLLPLSLRGLRTLIYSAPRPCGDRPVPSSGPDAERSPLVRKIDRGYLFCFRCQGFHPAGDFGTDKSRIGGKAGSCLRSLREARKSREAVRHGSLAGVGR
jgi:hypothetical protein